MAAEHDVSPAAWSTTGVFVMLCALLPIGGSGARKASFARRLVLSVCVAMLATFGFASVPALAAPPEAPDTGKVGTVTASTAVLEGGVLNPNAAGEPGEYQYLYRRSESECEGEEGTSSELALGFKAEAVPSVTLNGLQPNAHYAVCLIERNETGEAKGPLVTFETLPAPPKVDGEGTSAVSSTSATLEAQVNPNNQPTTYVFEYARKATGQTLEGTIVKLTGESALKGGEDQRASVSTGALLAPGTSYFYRVVAQNTQSKTEHKPATGTVQSFTTVPTPHTDPVSAITATTATFNGDLTLDAAATQYSFAYKAGSECTGGSSTPTAEAGSGTGSTLEATPVAGLQPNTTYTACFVTSNAFGSEQGSPITFRTLPEASVSDISASSATLHAVLDPEGSPTTYHFDYGPTAAYGAETPTANAGAGSSAVSVEFHLQGLSAASAYHFRVIATNVTTETFTSEDTTFTTQPQNGEFALPDGRQWEMVSPPDKHGQNIDPMTYEGGVIQAAENGNAITYVSDGPIVENPPGNRASEDTQNISRRGPSGWNTEDIATPHDDVGYFHIGEFAEYKFFSPDLSLGLVEPRSETPLAAPVLSGETQEKTIYRRNDSQCTPTQTEAIPAGCYLPLVTAANVEIPGSKIFTAPEEGHSGAGLGIKFQGTSPELRDIVFVEENGQPLTKNAVKGPKSLYEWGAGGLQLVSVLPNGEAASGPSFLGHSESEENSVVWHAVSTDGSLVIWRDANHLYLRDMEKQETVQLDVPEQGCATCNDEDAPAFRAASSDGSKIFFTDEAPLANGSSASQGERADDLYVFEVTSGRGEPLAGKLTDLTLDPHFGDDDERAEVQGDVIGASENGSYVYFVANGLLGDAGEHGATPGNCRRDEAGETCNLYVEHYGGGGWEAPAFIATLSGADGPDFGDSNGGAFPGLTARVSPDGRWLAFMSDRRLMSYDNADVNSGAADEEVFLFHAPVKPGIEAGKLVCASCNPTEERPVGTLDHAPRGALLLDATGAWIGHWLAGVLPGWTADELPGALYQSRYLSDNGRLFFDSTDALVSADVNGKTDVYEFEPVGVGGCEPGIASASVVYVAGEGGCVALISSGGSSQESVFLDASAAGGRESEGDEGGGDVFFLTGSQLTPQDEDLAFDIYDAHECSPRSPCVSPVSVAVPPACSNEASCKPSPEPQPSIYGLPSSATFTASANFSPVSAPQEKAKAKPLTRAQKLAKALKACKKKPKKKRAVCEKQAHESYGPTTKAKRASSGRGGK